MCAESKFIFTGAEQVTCSVEGCGMTLRCSADREKHEKDHLTNRNPPTCRKCGELCSSKSRLRLHLVSSIVYPTIFHQTKFP